MRPEQHYRHGASTRARFLRRAGLGVGALAALAGAGLVAGALTLAHALGVANVPRFVIPLFIITIVFLVSGVFRSMRRFGSPLWAVMDAADRVADGDYTVRVDEWGPPPIRALVRSFNTMTSRLQDADRVRRDLMADVAHELRTPLTVLQGKIEGLLDGVYQPDQTQLKHLLDETVTLSRLVEDLRTLALSDAGVLPLQKESTNVVDVARDVAQSFSGQHAAIIVPESADIVVDVDPVRIREVIGNLITNAMRYTTSGGRISIVVEARPDDVVVTVSDTGTGIAPDQLGRLFDRFYKGTDSRGSGLGLAIAKGIVTAHGGEIAATSTLGEGTSIRFTLPREPR